MYTLKRDLWCSRRLLLHHPLRSFQFPDFCCLRWLHLEIIMWIEIIRQLWSALIFFLGVSLCYATCMQKGCLLPCFPNLGTQDVFQIHHHNEASLYSTTVCNRTALLISGQFQIPVFLSGLKIWHLIEVYRYRAQQHWGLFYVILTQNATNCLYLGADAESGGSYFVHLTMQWISTYTMPWCLTPSICDAGYWAFTTSYQRCFSWKWRDWTIRTAFDNKWDQ